MSLSQGEYTCGVYSLGILPAFSIFICNGDFAGSEGSQWLRLGMG